MKRLAILIVVLLMGPSWAETESLKDIKIQYEIPSGFEVLSKSGSSGVYVHKDRDWQISINGRPASTMRPPENWLASAKKRARKDSKVSELALSKSQSVVSQLVSAGCGQGGVSDLRCAKSKEVPYCLFDVLAFRNQGLSSYIELVSRYGCDSLFAII